MQITTDRASRPKIRHHRPSRVERLPRVSVVIPVYNEAGNLAALTDEISTALGNLCEFEIVIVDDGSDDDTISELAALCRRHNQLCVHTHGHNRGQSAALVTGVLQARGAIIATLDGDGQNDPADIPALLTLLENHTENTLIAGERRRREDSHLRRFSSRLANAVRAWMLRDGIRDTGCGLKVFYRDAFLDLPAFDHMHRFLPALFMRHGCDVVSVPVNHRPRRHGRSKYGVGNRMWVGIVDLFGVRWLQRRAL